MGNVPFVYMAVPKVPARIGVLFFVGLKMDVKH